MKFIANRFFEPVGHSSVTIRHLGKLFTGKAYLHPDDKEYKSEIIGGLYAENRAIIKALKYERRILKDKCEECRKFVKACEQYKNFDKTSPTARCIYRQLNRRIKQVNKLTDRINALMFSIKGKEIRRTYILNKYEKKPKEDN